MVLRRELSGNAVGKSPSQGELEWGIGRIRSGLKNQPHRFGGILKKHLSCTVLDLNCCYKFTFLMANSADSDQLASDLDLHCLQRQDISRFSRTRVI